MERRIKSWLNKKYEAQTWWWKCEGTVKRSTLVDSKRELFQIHDTKLEIQATSRVKSLANVKHKAGGGDKKIFDDKEYIRQMNGGSELGSQTRSGPGSINGSFRGSNLQVNIILLSLLKNKLN